MAGLAFVGELGLDGSLRGVPGVLVLAEALVGPPGGGRRGERAPRRHRPRAPCLTAPTLSEVVARCTGRRPWPDEPPEPGRAGAGRARDVAGRGDLADIRGQPVARRALEVAAAGGHHLLLVGPPGAGKTLLATRLPGLLPELDPATAREVARIRSGAAEPGSRPGADPDRRSAHPTTGPVGGGPDRRWPSRLCAPARSVSPTAGCCSSTNSASSRLPSSTRSASRSRTAWCGSVDPGISACCPARFLLVAAMNPCPCGEGGMPGRCRCSPAARARYARRLSGPLLDRFDLALRVDRPASDDLLAGPSGESTATVADRVAAAREHARKRGVTMNSELAAADLDRTATLDGAAADTLARHLRTGRLSGRGLHRVRRMARTIADLDDGAPVVAGRHVTEALLLRGGRTLLLGEEVR